jgi:hypothetical protein
MILRNWAVQYLSVTRPPYYTSWKQARIRAIFAKGNPGPNVIWGTSGGPIFLHLSVLLFIAGGLIYLFNTNLSVFYAVVWWVAYMAISYAGATVAVFFEPHNLLHTPLSPLALRIYLGISYVVFQVCSYLPPLHGLRDKLRRHYRDLNSRYDKGFLNGKRRAAQEIASKPSSEIDALILERILLTLDEDPAWEAFFDAIPDFCNSKLSVLPLSSGFRTKFQQALDGFLGRTFSSSSISESVRTRRFIICLNAAHAALGFDDVSRILWDILSGRWPEPLQSVEMGHSLRRWSNTNDERFAPNVRKIVAQIVVGVRERDDRWFSLVIAEYGIAEHVLRDYIDLGDSVLLSILIHMTRQAFRTGSWTPLVLSSLSEFSIQNTLPGLQHAFCALWNDILHEARDAGEDNTYVNILREIRHVFIDLHLGTDAAPTFPAATYYFDPVLVQPWSYRYCSIASHRQDLSVSPSPSRLHRTSGGTATLEPSGNRAPHHKHGFTWPSPAADLLHILKQAPSISGSSLPEIIGTAITWDPDLLVHGEASAPSAAEIAATNFVRSDDVTPQIHTSESGETSQGPVPPPVIFQHPNSVPVTVTPSTGSDPSDDPDALQDTTSSATLSRIREGKKQQDTAVPRAGPEISEIPFTINPIPQPITRDSPTTVISDSPSSPIVLPAVSGGMTTAEPPSFVDSAPRSRFDPRPHP